MGPSWEFAGVSIHMVLVGKPPLLRVRVPVVANDVCTEALCPVLVTVLLAVTVAWPWCRLLFRWGNSPMVGYLIP